MSKVTTLVTKRHRSADIFRVDVKSCVGLFDPVRREYAAVGAVHSVALLVSPDLSILDSVNSVNQPKVSKTVDPRVYCDAIRAYAVYLKSIKDQDSYGFGGQTRS